MREQDECCLFTVGLSRPDQPCPPSLRIQISERWNFSAAKSLQLCPTVQPHRRQPTRLPCPWDSPGKNTGVGCHFLLQCIKVKSESEVTQSCPTLSNPMDCSLPGSSIHGIFQARVLEWGAISAAGGTEPYPGPSTELRDTRRKEKGSFDCPPLCAVIVNKIPCKFWQWTYPVTYFI